MVRSDGTEGSAELAAARPPVITLPPAARPRPAAAPTPGRSPARPGRPQSTGVVGSVAGVVGHTVRSTGAAVAPATPAARGRAALPGGLAPGLTTEGAGAGVAGRSPAGSASAATPGESGTPAVRATTPAAARASAPAVSEAYRAGARFTAVATAATAVRAPVAPSDSADRPAPPLALTRPGGSGSGAAGSAQPPGGATALPAVAVPTIEETGRPAALPTGSGRPRAAADEPSVSSD